MKSRGGLWALCAGPLVTLTLGVGWTLDTFNTVKLLVLGFVAGFAIAEIILVTRRSPKLLLSPVVLIAGSFLMSLLATLTLSGSPIAQQIYGVAGRNLGLLHYFFLTVVLLGFSFLKAEQIWTRILKSIAILGSVEACYGFLQYLGFDFSLWENPGRWIFGTFGNPNYLSSFLSFSVISIVYLALTGKSWGLRTVYFLAGLVQILVILLSDSSQGLILVGVGSFAVALVLLYQRSRILALVLLPLGGLGAVVATLGIFQYGPLSKFLYQDSVTYRGDYWRAGLRMFRENWIHGVGLDSYGDYYRMYRDATAANRRGLDVVSNSAHNLFIDIAATGGIFLLLSYLLILVLVFRGIVTALKVNTAVPLDYKFLVILWVLFNLQTLISINVPSLAIWGWIFSGLILAYNNNLKHVEIRTGHKAREKNTTSVIVKSVCCSVCLVLVAPLISRDAQLYDAFGQNDIQKITQAVLEFPRDADQIAQMALAFRDADLDKQSLELAKRAVRENSNSSRAWQIIARSSLATQVERDQAMRALKVLDPFYAATLK